MENIINNFKNKILNYRDSYYIDYPQLVTLETYTLCNASCQFCPYHKLKRKGNKMTDDTIKKIISDLSDIPSDIPITIVPVRVNEPFLDKRLISICKNISDSIKNTKIAIYTNGSILNSTIFKKLIDIPRFTDLGISLNYQYKELYEKNMKLPFDKTIKNIDEIYNEYKIGHIPFNIAISSVSNGLENDKAFISWASKRWPKFSIHILSKFNWLKEIDLPDCDPVQDIGCTQWFSLNILSDGSDAFCCIDSDGKYGCGNIMDRHLLDIYNQSLKRDLRKNLPSRKSVPICKECSFMASKLVKYGQK